MLRSSAFINLQMLHWPNQVIGPKLGRGLHKGWYWKLGLTFYHGLFWSMTIHPSHMQNKFMSFPRLHKSHLIMFSGLSLNFKRSHLMYDVQCDHLGAITWAQLLGVENYKLEWQITSSLHTVPTMVM